MTIISAYLNSQENSEAFEFEKENCAHQTAERLVISISKQLTNFLKIGVEKAMGPLKGLRIIEFAGLGPAPFCAMLLSDMGAEVIRIDRQKSLEGRIEHKSNTQVINRGRQSIAVDLKNPAGKSVAIRLVAEADAMIEGFRPGVMERLGLGPDICLKENSRLIYGRVTGWGQSGPLAEAPGHDINYIALTGALHAIGRKNAPPTPPLNLIGDFGGGAYLAMGILAAIIEARNSGKGQVIDTSMIDVSASMMAYFFGFKAGGYWNEARGSNYLDSGAPFYDTYETKDNKWIAIGSVESKFWKQTWKLLGLDITKMPSQHERENWSSTKKVVATAVRTKTRDEWESIFSKQEACVSPVLSLSEVPEHPHIKARQTIVKAGGIAQPGGAPRFSRTELQLNKLPPERGEHSDQILESCGFSASEIEQLKKCGAITQT